MSPHEIEDTQANPNTTTPLESMMSAGVELASAPRSLPTSNEPEATEPVSARHLSSRTTRLLPTEDIQMSDEGLISPQLQVLPDRTETVDPLEMEQSVEPSAQPTVQEVATLSELTESLNLSAATPILPGVAVAPARLEVEEQETDQIISSEAIQQPRQMTQSEMGASTTLSSLDPMWWVKASFRLYGTLVSLFVTIMGIFLFATDTLPKVLVGLIIATGTVIGFLWSFKKYIPMVLPKLHHINRLPLLWILAIVAISLLTVDSLARVMVTLTYSPTTTSGAPLQPSASSTPANLVGETVYTHRLYPGFFVDSVVWSDDGQYMATANGDNTVEVFDIKKHLLKYTFRNKACHSAYCWLNDVVFSPDSSLIAAASTDGSICVFNAPDGGNLHIYHIHAATVLVVDWSPDGKYIASGSKDKTVQIIEASTGKIVHSYKGHKSPVWAVAWSPDGHLIASGDDTGNVQVWNPGSGMLLYTYYGHAGPVNEIAWCPIDGERVATASSDGTVQIWDALTGEHFLTYRQHHGSVQTAQWSPDGRRIVSGGKDSTAQVWDVATGKLLYTYHGHADTVWSVAWSSDESLIASGSQDSSVQVWRAD
jgi:WD40 repeat protein